MNVASCAYTALAWSRDGLLAYAAIVCVAVHDPQQRRKQATLIETTYRVLATGRGTLPLDLVRVRHLLGRLARVLVEVPGGGRAAIHVDALAERLGLGSERGDFVDIATATGLLVQEIEGYVRFGDRNTLEYFTTVP
jgi:hypothetical protein